ncbi:MAG: ABC transporter ATP-binding protein [Planctomycetes bacterium]|jgi:ABC-2 type transport system ATP-binding protein|nr:ABC transporter ATP-binding protein [Planctomycetota bacterium]
MLKVQNLSKQFNKNQAVKNVSFEVKPGEIFALIGPNGSGKTTIVKVAAGLLKPTSGEVTVGGQSVTGEPVKAKAALGYIPDEPVIWTGLTGIEYLYFTGALYGLGEAECAGRIPPLLRLFNLGEIGQDYFEDYSRGNKQKFTILAALLHRPRLLLVDEPIVGLDPVSAEIAQAQFSDFARHGGAILLVTHTLAVAEAIAGRIGVLKKGELAAVGTLKELRERAQVPATASLNDIYKALA